MIIDGANLGKVEVKFNNLSNNDWTSDIEVNEIIKKLEEMYIKFYNEKDSQQINSFQVDENGKANIYPGMVYHKCSKKLDNLNNISKYGVLASEWFGILESEQEGRFCSFVSRIKNDNYPLKGTLGEDNYTTLNVGKNVILFFDDKNPIMQYLLHLDYFEYEYIKNTNPEIINSMYTKEEIDLLDKLVEPLSPSGKDMRKNYDYKTNYWSAIPGGIPPFLINGICIKNNEYNEEEINSIIHMFPNATIFNGNLDVLYIPNQEKTIEI